MASTNLLVWNPTAANQQTDAAYAADSQRAGGATDPSFFDALLANKAFYQWSTYLTALFQSLAAKGISTSDSNLPALVSACSNFLTTADVKPGLVQVPYSAALQFDASKSNGFQVALAGAPGSLSIINLTVGQTIALVFSQGAGGGYTVPWPANVVTPGTVSPTAGDTSIQRFIVLADGLLHPLTPMTVS